MDSEEFYIDDDNKLSHALRAEYLSAANHKYLLWHMFIYNMKLGISYVDRNSLQQEVYLITNPQQWMLTKIRYGI